VHSTTTTTTTNTTTTTTTFTTTATATRGVNVMVPRLNKQIVDGLAGDRPGFPYSLILLYSLVTLLQGGAGRQGGVINSLKNILWIR
jgi:hypothetical protein